jgi:hypothetical protein
MMILCATGPVDGNDRVLHEVVLRGDALRETRHLIGAAALAGRDDEFHRLGRLPGHRRLHHGRRGGQYCAPNYASLDLHCVLLLEVCTKKTTVVRFNETPATTLIVIAQHDGAHHAGAEPKNY